MAIKQARASAPIATPPITQIFPARPHSFFYRPVEKVAPELIDYLLVKRQADGSLLRGVIMKTEAYSQDAPACHGYRRRTPTNETLFGELGRFYRERCSKRYERFCQRYRHYPKGTPKCHWG